MKATQPKPTEDMRMSGAAFDKIMRQALQVTHEEAPKAKTVAKPKTTAKKKNAKK